MVACVFSQKNLKFFFLNNYICLCKLWRFSLRRSQMEGGLDAVSTIHHIAQMCEDLNLIPPVHPPSPIHMPHNTLLCVLIAWNYVKQLSAIVLVKRWQWSFSLNTMAQTSILLHCWLTISSMVTQFWPSPQKSRLFVQVLTIQSALFTVELNSGYLSFRIVIWDCTRHQDQQPHGK